MGVSFFNRLVGLPYEGKVQERAGRSDCSRVRQKQRSHKRTESG